MNKKDILDELSRVLPEGRTAEFSSPPPKNNGGREATIVDPRRNLSAVFALVRLAGGEWVKIGPYSKNAHQYFSKRAREDGVEVTSRVRGENEVDFYMRKKQPEVLASAVDTVHV